MTQQGQPPFRPDDWSPATSEPGELYTIEGRIKAVGAFARGLHNDHPRTRRYRHDMQRTGLIIVGVGVAAVVLISVAAAAL